MNDVQRELDRLRLWITHYSRCAIATHRRPRREWYEAQVARYERLAACLSAALMLSCSGCAMPTSPTLTLDAAIESYDWSRHTEDEFWRTYPQFGAQYEAAVEEVR